MNVGNIRGSCGGAQSTRQNQFSKIKDDFQSLQKALQSGDLSSAQSAFAALKQDLPAPKTTPAAGAPGAPGTAQNDLQSVESALSSGDLAGAQKAFATFRQDMQSARASHAHGHHHHQRVDQDSDGGDAASTTSSAAPPAPDVSTLLNLQA